MSLTFDDIGHVYGAETPYEQRALSGLSFSVTPGSLTLVLGPTGSGKSTMLRVGAGLLAPSEGSVAVAGRGANEGEPLRPGTVGLVFQRPEAQLFAESVLEDVAFGPRNLGASEADSLDAARDALEMVGLDPDQFGERSPFTLSGGEARRVALAGVLAMRPRYLFLDEPTAGLDARGRSSLRAAIEAARESSGVVVVSHDAEEFLEHADEVIILDGGTARFIGPVEELLTRHEVFERSGLEVPDVLRTQVLLRAAGLDVGELGLDPEDVAERIAAIGGLRS